MKARALRSRRMNASAHGAAGKLLFALIAVMPVALAEAKLESPSPPATKPPLTARSVSTPLPVTEPALNLKTRFRLSRKHEVTTVRLLAPALAALRIPDMPIAIQIDETIAPILTVTGKGKTPRRARVHILKADVEQSDLTFVIEDVEAEATFGNETIIDSFSFRLRPSNVPLWALPLEIAGRAAIDAASIGFHGTVVSADERLATTLDGVAQRPQMTGRLRFTLDPLAFTPAGMQPRDLVPDLGDQLSAVRGTIEGSGTVQWTGNEFTTSGRLSLKDLSFTVGGVGVEALDGAIILDRLWPPRTPPGQTLSIARIDPGLEVTNGTIRFQLDERGRLRIEHAAVAVSGGRLSLEPVTFNLQADRHDVVFRAEGLDLQQVLDAADVEAARISGSVSGRIPVSFSRQGIAVVNASLATDEEGTLRYQPTEPPAVLQQEDSSIQLLRDALTNFRYDRLIITLDGRSGHEWHSTVQIAGNNPDLLEGQPFILNVNLAVVPGQASLQLGAQKLDIGDTLPLYNALFGLRFLEWLGARLAAFDALVAKPKDR